MPLAVKTLGTKKGKLVIKKEIKLFHADVEQARKCEVTKLMYHH
jgi:hypothetical protein